MMRIAQGHNAAAVLLGPRDAKLHRLVTNHSRQQLFLALERLQVVLVWDS